MARAAATRKQAPKRRPRAQASESEHQLRQRKHILTHASLLFAEMGYAATTMDMLSAETRMNKASLYYYFASKQEILFVLLRDATMAALELSEPARKMRTAVDGIVHLIESGMKNLYSNIDVSRIFSQEFPYLAQTLSDDQYREIIRLQRSYMKIVYDVINQGVKSGEFRDGNVRLIGSLFASCVNAPLRFASSVSMEEMSAVLVDLFLQGLAGGGRQQVKQARRKIA